LTPACSQFAADKQYKVTLTKHLTITSSHLIKLLKFNNQQAPQNDPKQSPQFYEAAAKSTSAVPTTGRVFMPEFTAKYFIVEADADDKLQVSAELCSKNIHIYSDCSWTSDNTTHRHF